MEWIKDNLKLMIVLCAVLTIAATVIANNLDNVVRKDLTMQVTDLRAVVQQNSTDIKVIAETMRLSVKHLDDSVSRLSKEIDRLVP